MVHFLSTTSHDDTRGKVWVGTGAIFFFLNLVLRCVSRDPEVIPEVKMEMGGAIVGACSSQQSESEAESRQG